MAQILTQVARQQHPPLEAEHYFKMANRLKRFCDIRINLDVAEFDDVDTCIGVAILRFTLYETATQQKVLCKRLKNISIMARELRTALTYSGWWDFDHSVNEDASHFLVKELGFKLANSIAESLTLLDTAATKASDEVKAIQVKKGRKDLVWYDQFIFGMRLIAEKSNISLSVQDRLSPKKNTPFLNLVGAYEMCLPKQMRSPSRDARAKRIETSLRAA